MNRPPTEDPVEAIIRQALDRAGLPYRRDDPLDFELPSGDRRLAIECKRFYTPRIAEQLEGRDNVILVQGLEAARFLACLLVLSYARVGSVVMNPGSSPGQAQ